MRVVSAIRGPAGVQGEGAPSAHGVLPGSPAFPGGRTALTRGRGGHQRRRREWPDARWSVRRSVGLLCLPFVFLGRSSLLGPDLLQISVFSFQLWCIYSNVDFFV